MTHAGDRLGGHAALRVVNSPRVVIAHDYITQRGGAERVVLGLLDAFPGARLVTSVFAPKATFPEFADHRVETLWLNKVPAFRRDPRLAFPFLARAWSNAVIEDADVVLCSTSGWAHGVSTSASKVAYCYNPARWLYQPEDYLMGAGKPARVLRDRLAPKLMSWDAQKATEVSRYVTTSTAVAGRILEFYGRDSEIVPPPVNIDPEGDQEPVVGVQPGFLLSVSRARGYKNVQIVCDAVEGLPGERLVVIGDLPARESGGDWSERLQGVGRVSDAQLRWLYANCRAVVSASHEDFGLTPIEGNAFGKPAVLLRAGGFLDTLVEGITGCFIEDETPNAVRAALLRIPEVDAETLKVYAKGFRQEVFMRKMRTIVDEVAGRAGSTSLVASQPSASVIDFRDQALA
jgi:glycosyltransferase involved in cell wall biosynthesis